MAEQISTEKAESLFKVDIFDRISSFYKTTTGKTYTVMGISIVTLALLLLVAFRPTLKTIFELNNQIKQYTTVADALEQKHRNLRNLTFEYNTIVSEGGKKEKLSLLDQAIMPSAPLTDELFDDINYYAEENDVSIVQLEASSKNLASEYMVEGMGTERVLLSANGSINSIYSLIDELSDYPRPLLIHAVSLQRSETAPDIYQANIQLYIYHYINAPTAEL